MTEPEKPWQLEILVAANKQTMERLAAPPDSLDLKYNPYPVCPYCGRKYRDAWELSFDGDMEGSTEVECGGCEKPYTIQRNVEVTYSTTKVGSGPSITAPAGPRNNPSERNTNMSLVKALAERFCAAPLPESVCADLCATLKGPGRTGTNLLTVSEAEAVLGYTLQALSSGARAVLTERVRQVEEEGWTPEHDDEHDEGMLAQLGACYALHAAGQKDWWIRHYLLGHEQQSWFKPREMRRDFVRAAALLLAEIERLDRAAAQDTTLPDHPNPQA
jgi:hypothetical protein